MSHPGLPENPLLSCLETIPPGDLYRFASPEYVRRGFEYYRQGRVIRLQWSQDGQVLTVRVRGAREYFVELSADKKGVTADCTCPAWRPATSCKHVLCALFTLKNLLNPQHFRLERGDHPDREEFAEILFQSGDGTAAEDAGEREVVPGYAVELERSPYGGSVFYLSVTRDHQPVPPYFFSSVPTELRPLVRDLGYGASRVNTFLEFLRKEGGRHPLFLKRGTERIPLTWDPSLVWTAKTRLDVTGDGVTLEKVCVREDTIYDSLYLLGNSFAVNPETRRFGVLENSSGWGPWERWSPVLRELEGREGQGWKAPESMEGSRDDSISLPLSRFRRLQISVPEEETDLLDELILSVDGKRCSPRPASFRPHVVLEPNREMILLSLRCRAEGWEGGPTRAFFSPLFFFVCGPLSGPLGAKKRRRVLAETFMSLLTVGKKNQASVLIREALSNGDYNRRSVKGEARSYLMQAFDRFSRGTVRLEFHEGTWLLILSESNEEAPLYTVPFEIFGRDLLDGMTGSDTFALPADAVHRNLPILYDRLKERGIPLFFKGKPVESARWDLAFEVKQGAGIDWFEVRPEIRCNGELLDEKTWRGLLTRNGMVERGGLLQILDSNTQKIIETVASLYGDSSKSRKSSKEVVRMPRLQILDWLHLRSLGVRVKLPDDVAAVMDRLGRFEKIEPRPLPDQLSVRLRPYQREGYAWLAFLYENRFGACLADDMGLGKTLQAITLLAGIEEGKVQPAGDVQGPHLVAVPTSLVFNWENEIHRFYPHLKVHTHIGADRGKIPRDARVILTTYGVMRREIETLSKISFHVMIFDEAQALKNIHADTTGAARQLNGYFRLALTGTPVENHLGEYYSILDLCLPGLLGEYEAFQGSVKSETSPALERVLRRTKPFVLRRTKEAILKELPPKTETDIYLDLTETQKALYQRTVALVRSTVAEAYEKKTAAQAKIIALTALMKLRQICVSPRLLDPAAKEASPKVLFLLEKLKELGEEGHSALVFSQFTSLLDLLEDDLRKAEIPFLRLDGSTAAGKRKKLVEGFQKGEEAPVFLLSLKAGGQGLNLTRASYVFHLDPWWNPAVENQASDRAHRIGQNRKVSVTRILMRHTVEEKMMALKQKKLALYQAVMGESAGGRKGAAVSRADFDYLLE